MDIKIQLRKYYYANNLLYGYPVRALIQFSYNPTGTYVKYAYRLCDSSHVSLAILETNPT